MDLDVKLAVYRHSPAEVAARVGSTVEAVTAAYARLRALRLLVLEADGATIRMASPFSGIPTQHVVESGGVRYFANCGWDALGVIAALGKPGTVHSRCEQSGEPFRLGVGCDGPERSDWVFHCLVPAAHWWDDIVFT
jgi:hypothetical protein